jgi:hypothetical protein
MNGAAVADGRIHLSFTAQQLDYIANALGARPWGEVHALIADIGRQVAMHSQVPAQASNGAAEAAAVVQ